MCEHGGVITPLLALLALAQAAPVAPTSPTAPTAPSSPESPASPAPPVAPAAPSAPVPSVTATSTPDPAPTSARGLPGPAPILGPRFFDERYIDRINRNLRGVGVGFDQGLWGSGFGQSLKVSIPFGKRVGQFFGLRVRGLAVYGPGQGLDPVFGGGLEIFGRTPVFLGLLRAYGGGGAWATTRPLIPEGDTTARSGIGGGGHFGLEIVISPRTTFTFEIGGQSPTHARGLDGGASVTGGIMLYLGNLGGRG